MYIQNTLHIVQAWIIKYHPNIGSGTVSMLLKSPNKMHIHTTVFETSQPSLSFWGRERAGVAGQSTQWRAFSFCFAPWKHDKTQDKNWSASTRAMEDSSLYIFERHLDWSPKPNASSRRGLVPCSRRGGLANLDNWCGRLGRPGNSYRAAIGFCRKRLLRSLRYTERASRLLFCGAGWLLGREQGTGKNSYRGVVGFFVLVTFCWASFFPWQRNFLKVGAESRQKKILPWRSRILGLEALEETWLHRTRFPASFLWFSMVRDGL